MKRVSKAMYPFIHWLFPDIPSQHKANEYIAANMAANILGLGWAATPAGLKAMKELKKLEESNKDNISKKSYTAGNIARMSEDTYEASDMMCAFLALNISSLQLIPINMIAYRSQYGSAHPLAVAGPAFLATCVSTLAGVAVCRVMCRRKQYKSIKKGWLEIEKRNLASCRGENFTQKNKFIPYNALVKIRDSGNRSVIIERGSKPYI